MTKPENRTQMMARLGAKQRNALWSWCAVDEVNRKVYLSLWIDTGLVRGGARLSYLVQGPDWGVDARTGAKSPARNDQDEKLSLILEHGYEPFGYFVEAVDTSSRPRVIKSTKTSFVVTLKMELLHDGSIIGFPLDRVEIR